MFGLLGRCKCAGRELRFHKTEFTCLHFDGGSFREESMFNMNVELARDCGQVQVSCDQKHSRCSGYSKVQRVRTEGLG